MRYVIFLESIFGTDIHEKFGTDIHEKFGTDIHENLVLIFCIIRSIIKQLFSSHSI